MAAILVAALLARFGGIASESVAQQNFDIWALRVSVALTGCCFAAGFLFFPRDWLWSRGILWPPRPVRLSWGRLLALAVAGYASGLLVHTYAVKNSADRAYGQLVAELDEARAKGLPLPWSLEELKERLGSSLASPRSDLGELEYRHPGSGEWVLRMRILTSSSNLFGAYLVCRDVPVGEKPRPASRWTIVYPD